LSPTGSAINSITVEWRSADWAHDFGTRAGLY
jgi:hypothetical protein